MEKIIYLLCAATSVTCAFFLLRSYIRSRYRLLLWSGVCFIGLSVNNFLLVVDRSVPTEDLLTWRLVAALVALVPLLYALIWEGD